jgi:hypothetical protein
MNDGVLRKHKLVHLKDLTLNKNLFRGRFPKACATTRCKGDCCKTGVWVDFLERDRILANADLIRSHMEAGQEQNPDLWFDPEITAHPDFPSGQAAGTQVYNDGCVFLTSAGRCVLQTAGQNHSVGLKPFYCFAFPVTIEEGELMIDEGFNGDCCTLTADGELEAIEVCAGELGFVLGEEGLKELRQMAKTRLEQTSEPEST